MTRTYDLLSHNKVTLRHTKAMSITKLLLSVKRTVCEITIERQVVGCSLRVAAVNARSKNSNVEEFDKKESTRSAKMAQDRSCVP